MNAAWQQLASIAPVFRALSLLALIQVASAATFNVKDYGASGKKSDDARPAIQKAIEACAAAGGGIVLLPDGEYTSGTLRLRSRVRIEIAAGATLFASPDPGAYDFGGNPSKAALFFGEGLEDVALSGAGTLHGQAEYEWRLDDFERGFDHKILMQRLGKPLWRSFPKGFPARQVFPHLVWLGRCRDVRITGLKFLHSPSWTIALYACEQVRCDGLYVHSSLREAVWADGIDLDGCRDVVVANCTIATGDDCIVFISENSWGPARPCEHITVRNCRLSSASAGVKFSEGNRLAIRNIRVHDTVLTNVNRGFVLYSVLGGSISDVVLSNLTIHCNRFDWFWAGDGQPFHIRAARMSEHNRAPAEPGEVPPGPIRDLVIRNVVARAKGTSRILGHPESWLEGLRFENVQLSLGTDPGAPFDQADHALHFRRVRNLRVKDLQVTWEPPALDSWGSALYVEDIHGLELDAFAARGPRTDRDVPALVLDTVVDATVRNSRALEGAGVFLQVLGKESRRLRLQGNDFRGARVPYRLDAALADGSVELSENLLPR